MKLFTIGFTKKSAEEFFELLKKNDVKNLIDIRLNNNSHLAGFTKKEHLQYFLKEICNINYYHYSFLAPTKDLLKDYKNKKITWEKYEGQYISLLKSRNVMNKINIKIMEQGCLLCSEPEAKHCHRRLAAEYISNNIKNLNVIHL